MVIGLCSLLTFWFQHIASAVVFHFHSHLDGLAEGKFRSFACSGSPRVHDVAAGSGVVTIGSAAVDERVVEVNVLAVHLNPLDDDVAIVVVLIQLGHVEIKSVRVSFEIWGFVLRNGLTFVFRKSKNVLVIAMMDSVVLCF